MKWFGDVPDFGRDGFPPSREVAHHHQGCVVLGLSVEGDDLCSDGEQGDWVIVVTADFGCHWIDP